MKSVLMLLWGLALFSGCSNNNLEQESIPGTYVRRVYGKAHAVLDTVIIWHESDQLYHILHKQSQDKLTGKGWMSLGRKREVWMAVYQPDKEILVDRKQGLILAFDPDRRVLLVDGQAFHRAVK